MNVTLDKITKDSVEKRTKPQVTEESCKQLRVIRNACIKDNMLADIDGLNISIALAESELYGTPFEETLNDLSKRIPAQEISNFLDNEHRKAQEGAEYY